MVVGLFTLLFFFLSTICFPVLMQSCILKLIEIYEYHGTTANYLIQLDCSSIDGQFSCSTIC